MTMIILYILDYAGGLTCDDTNFSMKANAFASADREGIALVIPDTSPRGDNVPDDDNYDLGKGAGFYVDATNEPWSTNYNMYSYITNELPSLLEYEYGVGNDAKSIFGHSMGGHGALTIAMKDPTTTSWASVSAFSPICNPTNCPWGEKAFTSYYRSVEAGKDWDATVLMETNGPFDQYDDILIDQGLDDEFLEEQLKPEALEKAASKVGQTLTIRRHAGHDHSYYFMVNMKWWYLMMVPWWYHDGTFWSWYHHFWSWS